jgi:hypothetical protein
MWEHDRGDADAPGPKRLFNGSAKPYVRWWWLQGPFRRDDIDRQLDWLKENGFGGVEIAWIYPSWLSEPRPGPEWLGQAWSELVTYAKRAATQRGMGCDFTFGSSWPFGGFVVKPADAAQTFHGSSPQRVVNSWEDWGGRGCRVVNHLNREALRRYAGAVLAALRPALAGPPSALFCDSLELDTEDMWSPELWDAFEKRFGYRLERIVDSLADRPNLRHDYRALIAETMREEFFEAFARVCREAGAVSRVQCHGAPVDLLSAYASVDIPESEALLFEPSFSRIAASAAALADKPLVSCETFTCIYGFSHYRDARLSQFWRKEKAGDLKLLADAVFANGVNRIVWHGMPYNPPGERNEFYAAVHVGPSSALADELPELNRYFETVSSFLSAGATYTNLAVYLPNEDHWMLDALPREERTPGATHYWQMRRVRPPTEAEGYHPLWVSEPFLRNARVEEGRLVVGTARFHGLYLDCEWLNAAALESIMRLGLAGLPLVMKRRPRRPGRAPAPDYDRMLDKLFGLPNTFGSLLECPFKPLLKGPPVLPLYWARRTEQGLHLFVAHPAAGDIHYPMRYGQSHCDDTVYVDLMLYQQDRRIPLELAFDPCQSVCLRVSPDGAVKRVDAPWAGQN